MGRAMLTLTEAGLISLSDGCPRRPSARLGGFLRCDRTQSEALVEGSEPLRQPATVSPIKSYHVSTPGCLHTRTDSWIGPVSLEHGLITCSLCAWCLSRRLHGQEV